MMSKPLRERMQSYVETDALPGLVYLVATGGDVTVETLGTVAYDSDRPMARDSVFRIASISKPITAAAAMILVEEGTIQLDEPVDRLLPELADRRVLRSLDSDLDDTVPTRRPILIEDLLTLRMGFGSILTEPGRYPIQRAEAALGLATLGSPSPPPALTGDQWIAALGTLPVIEHPGERWLYNTGSQVLGVLVERAAGRPLENFLRERMFEPLGMVDTGFVLRPDQQERFTTRYRPDPAGGRPAVSDPSVDGYWSRPTGRPDAASWLLSTIDDLWAFAQMLKAGGAYPGGRVLSEASVAAMTTDHVSPAERAGSEDLLEEHESWGYGMLVPAAGDPDSLGEYGWDGGSGTSWRTHPTLGYTGILLTQLELGAPQAMAIYADFWAALRGSPEGGSPLKNPGEGGLDR